MTSNESKLSRTQRASVQKPQTLVLHFNSADERLLWQEELDLEIKREIRKDKARNQRMKELLVEKHKAALNKYNEIKRPLNLEKEQLRAVRKDLQQHVEGLLGLL